MIETSKRSVTCSEPQVFNFCIGLIVPAEPYDQVVTTLEMKWGIDRSAESMLISQALIRNGLQGLFVPFENVTNPCITARTSVGFIFEQFSFIHALLRRKTVAMTHQSQGQTGPKSIAGKRISSMNALKNGFFAKSIVLPFEDEGQYKKHCKQVMQSLDPQNSLEVSIAQQIVDSLWKGTRLEMRSAFKQEEVMENLKPVQMAALLGIEGKRQECAPDFLVTPNYHIAKKELVIPGKCLQQYEHLIRNVKGVANYESVWRQYKDLFIELHYWVQKRSSTDLFMSGFTALNLAWQQKPRLIEEQLELLTHHLWYLVHFDELRPQIRNWMASWYFLRSREANQITQGDDLALKERRHCQSLLDTYLKMRKSTQDHAIFAQKYLQMQVPDTNVLCVPDQKVA